MGAARAGGHARCGVFDSEWPKDVADLKPGEKLPLTTGWVGGPRLSFQYPGRVRLDGHYADRATGGKDGSPRPPEERGRMRGTPLFEVASEPVELEVVRPLDVRVRVKRPLKVGEEAKVSDALDVTVTNTTGKPRAVGIPGAVRGYRLGIRVHTGTRQETDWYSVPVADVPEATPTLQPGQSVSLTPGAGGQWKPETPWPARVFVQHVVPAGRDTRAITAEAVVTVDP